MEQFKRYFLGTMKDRYAQFSGRASRSEFWYFVLFSMIISILFGMLDAFLGTGYTYEVVTNTIATETTDAVAITATQTIGYLQSIYGLLVLLPTIAISVRRLHDTGKNGWWLLLGIIPVVNFIGIFVLLFFYVQDSQPGDNAYGENPKGL